MARQNKKDKDRAKSFAKVAAAAAAANIDNRTPLHAHGSSAC